jgi:hypothetical protein
MDAWSSEYNEDKLGTNLIIVRSKALLELLMDATRSGKVTLSEVTEPVIVRSQSGGLFYKQWVRAEKGEEKRTTFKKAVTTFSPRTVCYRLHHKGQAKSREAFVHNLAGQRLDVNGFEREMRMYRVLAVPASKILTVLNRVKTG